MTNNLKKTEITDQNLILHFNSSTYFSSRDTSCETLTLARSPCYFGTS